MLSLENFRNFKCYSTAEANEFIRKNIQNVRKITENPNIFNGLRQIPHALPVQIPHALLISEKAPE